jgi:hypothetical protein
MTFGVACVASGTFGYHTGYEKGYREGQTVVETRPFLFRATRQLSSHLKVFKMSSFSCHKIFYSKLHGIYMK